MKNNVFSLLLVLSLTACQLQPGPSTPTRRAAETASSSPQAATATDSVMAAMTNPPIDEALPSLNVDLSRPFADITFEGQPIILKVWSEAPFAGSDIPLPLNLGQVKNAQVLGGLTVGQKAFLEKNGFVVMHSQEAQFGDMRIETSGRNGQPYYLTTDAAFHALHLIFDDLLKALEKQALRPQMIAITKATLEQVQSSYPDARGTVLEEETRQAVATLSVALQLFDPEASVDASVADIVSRQVQQINAASGKARSILFPDFEDDYGAYKPVGHYAGDAGLEDYFRGMTWFGRMHFPLLKPEQPGFVPSRVPLIITLALRRAQANDQPASEAWTGLVETLNFIIGPSDDAGPLEYAALMDGVYGKSPNSQDLADETKWQEFLSQSEHLPAPQINSLFVASTADLSPEKGWRFMGTRFSLDGLIFQNLIFDKVQARPNGEKRDFPSGLDVMAAFGSASALQTLADQGVNTFPNYPAQMAKLQQAVQAQPEAQWLSRFYDGWLYAFLPVLKTRNDTYPSTMRTSAWAYKGLNSALGSWAELKHDTILYTKMPEMAGGGGPPTSDPAPSYVEPNPQAFYRMAFMAQTLASGLEIRLMKYPPVSMAGETPSADYSIDEYVRGMKELAERFTILGDIAVKELAGQTLNVDDNYAITSCLGMIECVNQETAYSQSAGEMPKPPVIAAVSGAGDRVLEVGVGLVDRIYVVVPLNGQQQVAQGGVFSYYEFTQPRNLRLTDDEWRAKLGGGDPPPLPAWAANFVLSGGKPARWLAFRKADFYIITEAGDKLNVRAQPSIKGPVVTQLKTGDYIEIIDGPVVAEGYTWWKVRSALAQDDPGGWAVENQEWYARSY